MSIHHLPLAQVTAALLEELRVNAVAESRMLDYKETLPGESDKDKKDLLADVTAFANTAGGDLIYGVKERRKDGKATGEPAEVVGLPGVVLDQEQLRLDATLRTGMDPRIPGLMLHAVPRGADPPCLVIRVPRSPHGIHMVTYKGSSRFYARAANGCYEMDWGQIRGGFLQAAEAQERVRRFREERVLRLLAGETPISMGSSAKVIVHALPLNALDVWPVFQTLTDMQRVNGLQPMGGEPSDWRYNLDGFVLHTTRENPSHQTYVQCFRDGGLEAMSGRILDWDPQSGGFRGWSVEVSVLQAVTRWQQHVWPVLGMAGPVAISLTLSGVKGRKILPLAGFFFNDRKETFDRDVVMLPELVVQDLATPVAAMLQPLFDLMWNCGGWAHSPSYVGPGKLRQS
jgi:hypothetical protein